VARQRYIFLAAAHSDVQQALACRAKRVEDRLSGLQSRVSTEASAAAARAAAAVLAWTVERPLDTGGVSPAEALATVPHHQKLASASNALG
jgi:hypothetical protein